MDNTLDKTKRTYLTIWDVLIVAVILFGFAFYQSTKAYIDVINNVKTINDNLLFTNNDDYIAFIKQFGLLLLAFGYLYIRKFDFRVWAIKFNIKAILKGLLYFIIAALAIDAYDAIVSLAINFIPKPSPLTDFLGNFEFSKILYAILNGFYEEIFFLGVCLSVKPKNIKWIIPISLIIRFSFHTYQGLLVALGIGFITGAVFYVIYFLQKKKNLVPFFIAHSIADVIGLSIFAYISTFFA